MDKFELPTARMRQRGSFLALTEANFGIFASVFQTKRVSEKVVKFQLPTAADAPERLATLSAPPPARQLERRGGVCL